MTEALIELPTDLWQITLSNLRTAGLLAPAVLHAPGALDTHPLVRTYFGERLRKQQPQAWHAAHLRLYEHYRTLAPIVAESLEDLAQLIIAMIHGCHAGRRQEALDEIFWHRIRRRAAHSVHHFGAFGADLTALSGLFERPWDEPAMELDARDQAFVLNEAGYDLRALGRLSEARAPMQASLDRQKERQEWRNAAIAAGNLSELLLSLGYVDRAIVQAEESVILADRGRDAFARMPCRTTLADALHQAGRTEESNLVFAMADSIRAAHHQYPQLMSLDWYSYCDLLLGCVPAFESVFVSPTWSLIECQRFREICGEVLERTTSLIGPSSHNAWLLALGHLALGRAQLGLAVVARVIPESERSQVQVHASQATIHLDQAVIHLRRSGREDYVPRGLLVRAKLGRWLGESERVIQDLTETLDIAERGSMRLHECDAHLEWARYQVSVGDLAKARLHAASARALIISTGYARRNLELDALASALSGETSSPGLLTRLASNDSDPVEQTIEMVLVPPAQHCPEFVRPPLHELHNLEGVWIAEQNGSVFCARVVDGELRVPYSYRGCGWLTSELYDCIIMGNYLLARFRWLDDTFSGTMRLLIESDEQLRGSWLYDRAPDVYPYPVSINLRRQPGMTFPRWAQKYFASIAKDLQGEHE